MMTNAKKFRRILALTLVLVLALSCMITAYATSPTAYNDKATITLGKTITTEESGVWPTITNTTNNNQAGQFHFLLEPVAYNGGPTGDTYTAYTAANLPMPGGSTGAIDIPISGFTTTATGTSQLKNATTGQITYTQAGIYTYKLIERIPGTADSLGTPAGSPVAGVSYDSVVYYVNVYVENVLNDDGTPLINAGNTNPEVNVYAITAWESSNTTVTDPTQPDNGGNAPIPSTPGAADDGKIGITLPDDANGDVRNISYPFVNDYNTASLIVTKTVTGDLADPNLSFSFTVSLKKAGTTTADTGTYKYEIYSKGADGAVGGTDDTLVTGNQSITSGGTFALKHNQYVKIIGLPTGEKVTTTETGATDYKTTIKGIHGNTAAPGTLTTYKTDVTSNKSSNADLLIVTGDGAVNQHDYVNKKESVTPTGVVLDVLPFVMIVAAASVGAVLLLRKKKTQQ